MVLNERMPSGEARGGARRRGGLSCDPDDGQRVLHTRFSCYLGACERRLSPGIDRHLDSAMDHHRAQRYADAEAGYRQALVRQPDHLEAMHFLGLLLHQTNRHAEGRLDVPLSPACTELGPIPLQSWHTLRDHRRLDDAIAAFCARAWSFSRGKSMRGWSWGACCGARPAG